ncbi:MAG: homoserine O-succinyltransferase [Clostridia bacterium]|nr:homoserine O-succinyltransferase [Oscillospiraceae bacterium]MBQ2748830.1 homoserine O-succinyltransferase [Clostridia bacterium]MBQ4625172.1 homoserine O-succinyltransferase [Clostridia bacterium]MBR6764003.1 homoserine O-succinyltransferase [Clostridia bacterium]
MPVKIPAALPAYQTLSNENVFVMSLKRASQQDIRPLRVIILNLMPTKIATETQILRCLSNTPLQIEVDFLQTVSHTSKNTAQEHLDAFYKEFSEIRTNYYDGMIITGAPVEQMDFDEVDYWSELCEILDWTRTHVYSTMFICWAAQAGLNYFYGVPKHKLPEKRFGVYRHDVLVKGESLLRGYDDIFYAPHSRHTEVYREDIEKVANLEILAESAEAGVYLLQDKENRRVFVTGHPEYDIETLATEYFRDLDKGLPISIPKNYFPDDDPTKAPVVRWRSHGTMLYTNWLNYYVYEEVPFDLEDTAKWLPHMGEKAARG